MVREVGRRYIRVRAHHCKLEVSLDHLLAVDIGDTLHLDEAEPCLECDKLHFHDERVAGHNRSAPLDVVDACKEEVALAIGDGLLKRHYAADLRHRLHLRPDGGEAAVGTDGRKTRNAHRIGGWACEHVQEGQAAAGELPRCLLAQRLLAAVALRRCGAAEAICGCSSRGGHRATPLAIPC